MGYSCGLYDQRSGKVATSLIPFRHRASNICVDGEALARGEFIQLPVNELSTSITSNYAPFFTQALGDGGIKQLEGMQARDSIEFLLSGLMKLNGAPVDDYWAATEGNAREALFNLFEMALNAPRESIWSIGY